MIDLVNLVFCTDGIVYMNSFFDLFLFNVIHMRNSFVIALLINFARGLVYSTGYGYLSMRL